MGILAIISRIVPKIRSGFERYASSGSVDHQDAVQDGSAVLINKIAIYCAVLAAMTAVIDSVRRSWIEVATDLIICFMVQWPIWLNRWRHLKQAKIATVLIGNACVVLNCLVVGTAVPSTALFFAVAAMAAAIFDSKEWRIMAASILLSVTLSLVLSSAQLRPQVVFGGFEATAQGILIIITFAIIVATIRYFSAANEHARRDFEEMLVRQRLDQARLYSSAKLASLGQMAAGIVHEINNPLAVIHGRASQLTKLLHDETLTPAKTAEYLQSIQDTTARISKIIKALLAFAREQKDLDVSVVEVRHIIDIVYSLCQTSFVQREIILEVNDQSNGIKILANSIAVQQVLLNLLNNAADAITTPEAKALRQPWIKLEILRQEQFVNFLVTDSGTGIAPDVAEKMMEPFFTTKEQGNGTGLGLSIANDLAKKLGGELVYDDTCPNTRFILRIPAVV